METQQKPAVRAELARPNNGHVPPAPDAIATAMEHVPNPVLRGEWEFVLRIFEDLKKYGEAELRISITPAGPAKQPEIIYAGIHQKRSLGPLRRLYRMRGQPGGTIRA